MSKMKKLKKARFALPSLITLGSVFCSFMAIATVMNAMPLVGDARLDKIFIAALLILASIVCDLFDGKVARKTGTSSKFGMELDSLADGVSFGIAPAFVMYGFILHQAGIFGIIACFLYVSGTLVRLARFNIEAPDEGVQTYFKGIPAPGGAATIAAIIMAAIHTRFEFNTPFEINTIGAITIAIGFLMVSTVKYKTLKGKKTIHDWIYIGIGVSFFVTMCFVLHPTLAFFLLVCYFIGFGMLNTVYLNLKHGNRRHSHKHRKTIEMQAVKTDDSTSEDASPAAEDASPAAETKADQPEETVSDESEKDADTSSEKEDTKDSDVS
ncbi:MAG: phosphatidylcholine/phosphatidylserine synthase [Proteobacteria bacterium]|nr:phosphatidylcholine/phosphatidylserine synthase [Pseudomonadota bacterium]